MSQGGDFQGGEYCQGTLTTIGMFGASVCILTDKVIVLGMIKVIGAFWCRYHKPTSQVYIC